jgi:hypothetical protein
MRTRVFNGKEQIFCAWRHRWVRLTPEEWVRQQLLHRMVEQLGYPASLIAVEVAITVGEVHKRCDAVVYGNLSLPSEEGRGGASPLLLIECKAETVPLTQKTLDQAITYNRKLNVPFLLLHNGPQSIFVTLNPDGTNHYAQRCPGYTDLLRCE